MTSYNTIYDSFLSKITDDMYLEFTLEDTKGMLDELFKSALPYFEFPRVDIFDYDDAAGGYAFDLSLEEIDIIATYMVAEWVGRQLASVEQTRMKYSGSDFKFTSQANHIAKLLNLKDHYTTKGFHLQRLYKRRAKDSKGRIRSTFGQIMETPDKW